MRARGSVGLSGVGAFGGMVINAALAMVLLAVVSTALGSAQTGRFFQAVAVFTVLTALSVLGADTSLVRFLSRYQALRQEELIGPTLVAACRPALALSLALGASGMAMAPQLAEWWLGEADPPAVLTIRVLCGVLPAAVLLALALATTRGLGLVAPYTLIQNVAVPVLRVTGVAVGVAVVGAQVGVVVVAWGLAAVIAALVALGAAIVVVRRVVPGAADPGALTAWRRGERSVRTEFRSFALPRGASTLIERLLEWVDVLVVIAIAGPAAGGVYGVVTRCAAIGTLVENAARIVLGPRISQALALDDMDGARGIFEGATRALILATWPLYLTFIVFGDVVLELIGPGFGIGHLALVIISAGMMVAIAAGMLQSFLLMGGRSHWQLGNRLVQLTLLVIGSLALVGPFGIEGAALAWSLAIVVDATLAAVQVNGRMRVRTSPSLVALPSAVAVTVFGLGGWGLRQTFGSGTWTMLGITVALAVAYAGLIALLRGRLGLADLVRARNGSPRSGAAPELGGGVSGQD